MASKFVKGDLVYIPAELRRVGDYGKYHALLENSIGLVRSLSVSGKSYGVSLLDESFQDRVYEDEMIPLNEVDSDKREQLIDGAIVGLADARKMGIRYLRTLETLGFDEWDSVRQVDT